MILSTKLTQAQLLPVAKMTIKTQQAFLKNQKPKTEDEAYIPGTIRNVTGFARIDHVKEGDTTWLIIQCSTLGADPVMHIVSSTAKEIRDDGGTFYDVDTNDLKGRPVKFYLIYKGGQLKSVNIDSGNGFVQFE